MKPSFDDSNLQAEDFVEGRSSNFEDNDPYKQYLVKSHELKQENKEEISKDILKIVKEYTQ